MTPTVALSRFGGARARFAQLTGAGPVGDALEALTGRLDVGGHDVDRETAFLAAELVRWQPEPDARDQQALMLLALASVVSVRDGSTRLPLGDTAYLRELGDSILPGSEGRALLERAVAMVRAGGASALIGGPDDYRPFVLADDCLYQHRMRASETRLVERLRARRAQTAPEVAPAALGAALAAIRADGPFRLSSEQLEAVRAAIVSPFAVISGGPGTGKTAIVVSILRTLARLGVEIQGIALAAPTGKAAQRMRSSIATSLQRIRAPELFDLQLLRACPAPQTLHRLLGYSPHSDRFRHHENNRLAQRVVIVDEGSMIDLFMMERLLQSVRDDARLVLLGDADQLPSVDSGAVLRDLTLERTSGTVRLTRSYRMNPSDPAGRAILTVAQHINAGRASALDACTERRAGADELAYHGVERLDTSDPAALSRFLDCWYAQRIRNHPAFERWVTQVYHHGPEGFSRDDAADLDALFAHFDRARLLTVTRGRGAGARAVNQHLHSATLAATTLDRRPDFYPGEPVLMRENDYDRGIFNGDQGVILRVAEAGERQQFRAVFPRPPGAPGRDASGGYRVFHLDALRHQLELAFAMTVHKSQGSEFDHVALLLPSADVSLVTRELLYTACTRARASVTIVGDQRVLSRGVLRRARRFSGVAAALGD